MVLRLVVLGCIAASMACAPPEDHSNASASANGSAAAGETATGEPPENATKLLFFGNSHTAVNSVPTLVENLLESDQKEPVFTQSISGAFLNDIWKNAESEKQIKSRKWDAVVLQGALLSSSHSREYPNDGTIGLAKASLKTGARTLFFVEWPRKGWDESGFQYGHYKQFAKTAGGGELVPICFAWDAVVKQKPDLDLWAADGNHAGLPGSYLAACTISYWLKRGEGTLKWAPDGIDPKLAEFLRDQAKQAVLAELEKQKSAKK